MSKGGEDLTELSQVEYMEEPLNPDDEKAIERRLVWKIDLRILPILTFLYIFASMDRSDIGNAQVAGMQKAIGASAQEWTLVAALFYLGYIVSQPIGTLYLRSLSPPNLFAFACCLWGALTAIMLTATNYAQATGIRVCIGFAEGLLQAAPLYLSLWYKPSELGTRGAIFFSVSSLASACNGLIAYGLVKNFSSAPPFQPWQWLFLIEGLMSVTFAIVVFIFLPPVPEKITWGFTADEKRVAMTRSQQAYNTLDARVDKSKILVNFKKPFIYFLIIAYSGTIAALSSLTNFLPSIVQGLGYSSVNAQLMTVPVYAFAFVSTIFFGHLSDRFQIRGPLAIGLLCIAMIGYIILIADTTSLVTRYAALCIIGVGIYPCVPIILTWSNVNIIGFTQRATAAAGINMIAQIIGVVVNLLFNTPPYYITGISVVLALIGVAMLASLSAVFWLRLQNKRKREAQHTTEVEDKREMSIEEIGNEHPDFFYTI